jgi:hypothetical protein
MKHTTIARADISQYMCGYVSDYPSAYVFRIYHCLLVSANIEDEVAVLVAAKSLKFK